MVLGVANLVSHQRPYGIENGGARQVADESGLTGGELRGPLCVAHRQVHLVGVTALPAASASMAMATPGPSAAHPSALEAICAGDWAAASVAKAMRAASKGPDP